MNESMQMIRQISSSGYLRKRLPHELIALKSSQEQRLETQKTDEFPRADDEITSVVVGKINEEDDINVMDIHPDVLYSNNSLFL